MQRGCWPSRPPSLFRAPRSRTGTHTQPPARACCTLIVPRPPPRRRRRGYDVALFAAHGASSSTGVEISATAAKEARDYLASSGAAAAASVAEADFFGDGHGPYDVGYDYT